MTRKPYLITVVVVAVSLLAAVFTAQSTQAPARRAHSSTWPTDKLVHPVSVPVVPRHIHWGGRSRGQIPPTVSAIARPASSRARKFPGINHDRWVLTRTRTLAVVKWIKDNEAKTEVALVGSSGVLCAALFSESGPGAILAGGGCSLFVAFYWASIKDAKNQLTKKKACLRVTASTAPVAGAIWFDFDATKCRRFR